MRCARRGDSHISWAATLAERRYRRFLGVEEAGWEARGPLEGVAHADALGFEVSLVVGIGGEGDGELLGDFEAVAFEADDFFGVVGHQADFPDAEVGEDLGSHAVVAEV